MISPAQKPWIRAQPTPWTATLTAAMILCAMVFQPASGAITLVRSTSSSPNDAERKYAESMTLNLDRWLNELSIPHDTIDDDQVMAGGLKGSRVALLGYNPFPPARELSELRSFTSKGGKLIVFYSAEPELASMMGLKMGKYLSDPSGRWSAMRFNDQAPAHLPEVVFQTSRNIRPVFPADPNSKVIASWETASGTAAPEPAWLQTPAGFWMTHVLLDDGDTWNKKQMLVALIGSYDPSVWKPAATRCLENSSTLGGRFPAVADATTRIPAAVDGVMAARRVQAGIDQATMIYGDMNRLFKEQQYPAVVEKSHLLRVLLRDAYAGVQTSKKQEFRGVWNRFGTGLYPGDWDRTCKVLERHHITDVFPFAVSPTTALYPSHVVPPSALVQAHGDILSDCVKAAHRQGLKVHAWKICWKMEGAPEELIRKFQKQGRLQLSDTGQTVNWLCPSLPENIQLEKDQIREIVKAYDVDGIHLDYIRFQDGHVCFCAHCRAAFEHDTGRKTGKWPASVLEGDLRRDYRQWRCNQITRLVKDIGTLARDLRPGIQLSAAVYGKYPTCLDSVAQDWASWLRNGYVDFVCPMDYTPSTATFSKYVKDQMALPGLSARIFPGIGVTATESRLDAVQVIDQIGALRREGAGGFALFELNRVLEKEILPALSLGIIRD